MKKVLIGQKVHDPLSLPLSAQSTINVREKKGQKWENGIYRGRAKPTSVCATMWQCRLSKRLFP